MSEDTENFESLCRLLALKRHEVPPPGYFNNFSRQVIARIKAGERGEESVLIEGLLWEAPWLRRLWAALEAKPILAGLCSVAACGLLIGSVIYSDSAEVPPVGLVPVTEMASAPVAPTAMPAADHPLLVQPAMLIEAPSTSPILPRLPEGRLLDDLGQLRAQRASYPLSGGN